MEKVREVLPEDRPNYIRMVREWFGDLDRFTKALMIFTLLVCISLSALATANITFRQHASSCGGAGAQCLSQPCCTGFTCQSNTVNTGSGSGQLNYSCHIATQSATLTRTPTPSKPATPSATPYNPTLTPVLTKTVTPTPALVTLTPTYTPISYTCQNISGQSCLSTRLGTSCTNTDPTLTTGSGTCPTNYRCCKKFIPTPTPYSACTGNRYVGGVCGKDGRLYSCNGAGGTNSVVACAYGCQVNSGTYDACRCPYSCISSRICNSANDLRTFPVTGSCSSGSVCCKSL
jgi:hypothetical protein